MTKIGFNPAAVIERTTESLGNVVGWIVTVIFVICSAFFGYLAFYRLYVPEKLLVIPVHFEFNTHGYYNGFHHQVPQALVSLRDGNQDAIPDSDRILSRGQRYIVSLVLHVPLSEENKNVGMFMTTVTLLSKQKQELSKMSRSALIPYSSPVVSTLGSILDFVFLHWRWKQESEKLKVVLFENFIDDSYRPAEYARVAVHCKNIQIYSAELRIEAVFSGIRYFMFYWPLSSAAFGITSNILFGIIIASWLYFKFCKDYAADDESEESFEIDDLGGSFLNTDTESSATNLEDTALEQERGPIENQTDVQQRNVLQPQRPRPRHAPLRRLANRQARMDSETNEPLISLTRRPRPTRSKRDQGCQTELPGHAESPRRSKMDKVD